MLRSKGRSKHRVWTVFAYFFPLDKLRLFSSHSDMESIEDCRMISFKEKKRNDFKYIEKKFDSSLNKEYAIKFE